MQILKLGCITACAIAIMGCGGPEEMLPEDELGLAEQEAITCTGPQGDAHGNGPDGPGVRATIRDWFGTGARGDKAIAVAKCESGYWSNCCASGGGTKAHYNYASQYKGLFQMGENERAQYGFNWCAGGQAKGAFGLWQDRGWQPWACAN